MDSSAAEELGAAALSLSRSERARLAERLIASLDEDAEIEQAWRERSSGGSPSSAPARPSLPRRSSRSSTSLHREARRLPPRSPRRASRGDGFY